MAVLLSTRLPATARSPRCLGRLKSSIWWSLAVAVVDLYAAVAAALAVTVPVLLVNQAAAVLAQNQN
jgi:hypothetical protein